jgi:hypothetical protein
MLAAWLRMIGAMIVRLAAHLPDLKLFRLCL